MRMLLCLTAECRAPSCEAASAASQQVYHLDTLFVLLLADTLVSLVTIIARQCQKQATARNNT